MTLNIFGPYGSGINPTTTRPADTGEPGATDTWFQPCSSPSTNDGTLVSYRWLNKILATIRRATRGMGIADDPASDDLLLEAIKSGATLRNAGTGVDLYAGQDSVKAHLIRRIAAGSNVTLTEVEGPSGEHAIRIAVTVPGSGPSGNTIGNVGDGADVYKGTNSTVEELRGVKGIGPVGAVVNGDNIEVGIEAPTATMLMRAAAGTGQSSMQSINSLTAETSPANADEMILQKAGGGELRKVSVQNIRGTPGLYGIGTMMVVKGGNVAAGTNVSVAAINGGAPSGSTWIKVGTTYWFAQTETGDGDWLAIAQRTA